MDNRKKHKYKLGLASLILGILSWILFVVMMVASDKFNSQPVFNFFFSAMLISGALSLCLGIAGLFRKGLGRGFAIAGMILCGFALLVFIFIGVMLSGLGGVH